jgi:uncharacterized integral membrane protein
VSETPSSPPASSSVSGPPTKGARPAGPPPLKVHGTRTSRTWIGIAIGLFLLLLVAIFVGQNLHDTRLNFLWVHGTVTAGLAILIAFVVGGLFVVLIGTARVTQLRLAARRHRRAETRARP